MVQHLDGRFGLYDIITDQHTDGDQNPTEGHPGQLFAEIGAERCKAHVQEHIDEHDKEEQHQTDVCIRKANGNALDLPLLVTAGHHLENQKHRNDRQQRYKDFFGIQR